MGRYRTKISTLSPSPPFPYDMFFLTLHWCFAYIACVLVLVNNIGLSKIMVFNATFNNISVISFRTVLMAEKKDSNSQLTTIRSRPPRTLIYIYMEFCSIDVKHQLIIQPTIYTMVSSEIQGMVYM